MPVSIWMKPFEYMKDWNCNAPSSSQNTARAVCSDRLMSDAKYVRALDRSDPVAGGLEAGARTLCASALVLMENSSLDGHEHCQERSLTPAPAAVACGARRV